MGICEGPIAGINNWWLGKSKQNANGTLGYVLGTYPQDPWAYLTTNFPAQALNYPGIAWCSAAGLLLGGSDSLPNFNFEVQGFDIVAGENDANPASIISRIVSNSKHGLNLSANAVDVSDYSDWCLASGLLISPTFTDQKPALDVLSEILEETFSVPILHDGNTVKVIPLADTAVTSGNNTWTPNVTPRYNLTDDDFLGDKEEDPIKITRRSPADRFNNLRLEVLDRSRDYNVDLVEAYDQESVDNYRDRPNDIKRFHHICQPAIGKKLAQLYLQRGLYIINNYTFRLGHKYQLLECMDVVTLTDSGLGMNQYPVRITRIEETEENEYEIEAEDFPSGIGHAVAYPSQSANGYQTNYNIDPGNINPPFLFVPPLSLTRYKQYELWMGLSGGNDWGGADVYVSSDNNTYNFLERWMNKAVQGVLSANCNASNNATISLNLNESQGTLTSLSSSDANIQVGLCAIKTGNNTEIFSYQTANLTSQYNYNMTVLKRGLYGTNAANHNANDQFLRLSHQSLLQLPLNQDWYARTLYFKFCSFNYLGLNVQDLANATAYSLTDLRPPSVDMFKNLIVNGSGMINQRQIVTTDLAGNNNGVTQRVADRWWAVGYGMDAAYGYITPAWGFPGNQGRNTCFTFDGLLNLNGTFELQLASRIRGADAKLLRYKRASLGFMVYHTGNNLTGMQAKAYIYKADALDNFNNSTLIIQTALFSVPDSLGVWAKFENIDMGDCANGVQVYVALAGNLIGSNNVPALARVKEIQLELNDHCTPYDHRVQSDELSLCKLDYTKSFLYAVQPEDGPADSNGYVSMRTQAIGSFHEIPVTFPVSMSAIPSITLHNPTIEDTANDLRNFSANSDHPAIATRVSTLGFTVQANNANIAASQIIGTHYEAETGW
jgi:hypothetical protein